MSGFIGDVPRDQAFVSIQWKGTNACLDFHCECGQALHFDDTFCYVLHCDGCGRDWEMPCYLYPRLNRRNDDMPPRRARPDPEAQP